MDYSLDDDDTSMIHAAFAVSLLIIFVSYVYEQGRREKGREETDFMDHISDDQIALAETFPPLMAYKQELQKLCCEAGGDGNDDDDDVNYNGMEVSEVVTFKTKNGPVAGFVSLHVHLKVGRVDVPEFVLLSNPAIGVFVVVNGTHILCVRQFRAALLGFAIETPAGIWDDIEGDPRGKGIEEVFEETGVRLKGKDLVMLTTYQSSIGRMREAITLYGAEIELPREKFAEICARVHGNANEGERTRVVFLDASDEATIHATGDPKLMLAHFFWKERRGSIV